MKSIANIIHQNKFTLKIFDNDGNIIYGETLTGFWSKRKYDFDGNEIYYESATGFWAKRKFDTNGTRIYYEDSEGITEYS